MGKISLGIKSTIYSLLRDKHVDIYHYNAMAAGLSSILPIHFKKKVIFQGHGFEWRRAKWTSLERKIIKYLDNLVIRFNRNVIMVSEEQTKYVKENFKKKAVTITPGVILPNSNQLESDILERFRLKSNKYFLFLGRLVPEKNPDRLIEAFVSANIIDKQLVIAGDALNENAYINYLKSLANGNNNIIFTGAVYNEDKDTLLKNCFSFCIPSSLEGLPIALLEAMSYSRICLSSNIDACKEALGNSGIYFDLNNPDELKDKLNEINNNFNKFAKLGELAYYRIKNNFTWDIIVNKYHDYIKEIMKG